MHYCYICKDKKSRKDVSYHNFPKDPVLREKWKEIVGLTEVTPSTVICGIHFKYDRFIWGSRIRLSKGSVPTEFLPQIDQVSCSNQTATVNLLTQSVTTNVVEQISEPPNENPSCSYAFKDEIFVQAVPTNSFSSCSPTNQNPSESCMTSTEQLVLNVPNQCLQPIDQLANSCQTSTVELVVGNQNPSQIGKTATKEVARNASKRSLQKTNGTTTEKLAAPRVLRQILPKIDINSNQIPSQSGKTSLDQLVPIKFLQQIAKTANQNPSSTNESVAQVIEIPIFNFDILEEPDANENLLDDSPANENSKKRKRAVNKVKKTHDFRTGTHRRYKRHYEAVKKMNAQLKSDMMLLRRDNERLANKIAAYKALIDDLQRKSVQLNFNF